MDVKNSIPRTPIENTCDPCYILAKRIYQLPPGKRKAIVILIDSLQPQQHQESSCAHAD